MEIKKFLTDLQKEEKQYIYSLDTDDETFGVETDRLRWCNLVLEEKATLEEMLKYFKMNYGDFEQDLIYTMKNLIKKNKD